MHISERQGMIAVIIIGVLAVGICFYVERYVRQQEHPGLWSISFVDPVGNGIETRLSNRSSDRVFHLVVINDGREIGSREIELTSSTSPVFFSPESLAGVAELSGEIRIRVTDVSGNTREIFKRIE